jgi:hypothetical protein
MDALASVLREAGFDADDQELANLLATDEEQGVQNTVDFDIDLLFSTPPPPPPPLTLESESPGTLETTLPPPPPHTWTASGDDEPLQQPGQIRDEHKERTEAEAEVRIILQKVRKLLSSG